MFCDIRDFHCSPQARITFRVLKLDWNITCQVIETKYLLLCQIVHLCCLKQMRVPGNQPAYVKVWLAAVNGIIFHFNNWCVVILAHSEPVQLPGSLEGFLCGVSVFEVLSTCSLLRAQKPPFQESMYSLSFYNDLSFTPKHRSCLPFFFLISGQSLSCATAQ